MIDENVLERLKPYLTEVSYPKGYVLFNSEKLERNIYFIKRGMARAFVEADGRDVTIWFGQEGDVIISARGYVYGEKGYCTARTGWIYRICIVTILWFVIGQDD